MSSDINEAMKRIDELEALRPQLINRLLAERNRINEKLRSLGYKAPRNKKSAAADEPKRDKKNGAS